MEGAAVAQVASQEEVPWLVIGVISDNADEKAAQNFNEFLEDYNKYSWNLIESLMINHLESPFYKDLEKTNSK